MYGDFQTSTYQGNVKELTLFIKDQQSIEEGYIRKWSSGLETSEFDVLGPIREFNTTRQTVDSAYLDLYNQILQVQESAGNSLDVSTGMQIYDNITDNLRPAYLNDVYTELFSLPSLDILSDLQYSAASAKYELSDMLFLTTQWLVNRSVATLDDLRGTLNDFQSFRTELATTNLFIFEINRDLYNEKNQIIIQLSTAEADIRTALNRIINAAEVNDTLYELLPEDQERLAVAVAGFNATTTGIFEDLDTIINDAETEKLLLEATAGQLSDDIRVLNDNLQELVDWASSTQGGLNNEFLATSFAVLVIGLTVFLLSVLTLGIIFILLNRQAIGPIVGVTKWSQLIAIGDLSKTKQFSPRKDEVGILENNFKIMNKNLRLIISDVQETSSLIAETAEDLSSNTEEINATAEEVSSIATHMATGSTQQAEIISTIVDDIQEANHVVDSVISQITNNLSIVKDLSEQTNVLALNTAIEAANAGEYGRGFMVIADNIRKMSDQSSRTAKIITRDSKEILNQLQITFGNITKKIINVASVSEETAASAEEVSASAQELTSTMEEIAAKSTMLNNQSLNSLKLVQTFHLGDEEEIMRERQERDLETSLDEMEKPVEVTEEMSEPRKPEEEKPEE